MMCPLHYVGAASEWVTEEYGFYETFPHTAPDRSAMSSRCWDAIKLYKLELKKAENEKSKDLTEGAQKARQEKKTSNSLNLLKSKVERGNNGKSKDKI